MYDKCSTCIQPQFIFGGKTPTEDTTEQKRLYTVFCALLGAMISAVAYVTVRKVGRGTHFIVRVVFAFLFSIFILHEYPYVCSISGASIVVLVTSANENS